MTLGTSRTYKKGELYGTFSSQSNAIQTAKKWRDLIVGLDEKIPLEDGRYIKGIYLGNAATTPPFKSVLKAIEQFAPWYSSIGRGKSYFHQK